MDGVRRLRVDMDQAVSVGISGGAELAAGGHRSAAE